MKAGTPGFIGARLVEAREARGLSITTLAELAGLSRQTLHNYEKGEHSPQPKTLEEIALKLNMPQEYFFKNLRPMDELNVFYRSRSPATKPERVRGERQLAWLRHIVVTLSDYLELPGVKLQAFDIPDEPLLLAKEEIEELAIQCRRHWGLGDKPISNIVLLLENNGIVVSRSMLEAPQLNAYSCLGDMPCLCLSADNASRSRFDAAHELAHLILHRRLAREDFFHPLRHREYENQADRFAAAFLMPGESFAGDITTISLASLRALKPKWKVSIASMLTRCQNLGLVGEEYARKLWIAYTRAGYRKREPLDEQIPIEEPRLLRRCMDFLLESRTLSKYDILSALALSATDVEALCCLPPGYLGENGGIYLLPKTNSRKAVARPISTSPPTVEPIDNIIRFPKKKQSRKT
ncbi:MAG: XRE family transcriptional regulator [Methylococcaceae bacterium]|nr:XRE family transcriptional regulator [Methylococcaceae bacterium]